MTITNDRRFCVNENRMPRIYPEVNQMVSKSVFKMHTTVFFHGKCMKCLNTENGMLVSRIADLGVGLKG